MFRLIFIFILSISILNGASSDKKILKKIIQEEKNYNKIIRKLKDIKENINSNKVSLDSSKEKLNDLNNKADELNKRKDIIEKDIVDLVSKRYAITSAIKQESKTTEKSAINRELYKVILKSSKNQITKLNSNYISVARKIAQNKQKTANLDKNIKKLKQQEDKLTEDEKKQKKLLAALKKKRKENSKRSINSDYYKDKKAKRTSKKQVPSTKKTNDSYVKGNAPLKDYTISRGFGAYFDEEQQMELFNDSLYLSSNTKNAKVYNILEGKVVYVKKNSNILGNVVIIKHKNNIYTIYSHLNQIYSSIKTNRNIKAGKVIGRINRVLKLKATKNTTYIDPMELIK
jgi:murein DD-endopeptidase MepM/ murein hydrolase activator NlpD